MNPLKRDTNSELEVAIDDEGFVLSVHWISWTRSAQTKSDRVVSLPLHSTILEAVLDYLYEDHTAKVLSLSLSLSLSPTRWFWLASFSFGTPSRSTNIVLLALLQSRSGQHL